MPKPQTTLSLAFAVAVATPVLAVRPQAFTHATEADFQQGTADGVVVTNLGEVKLAPARDRFTQLPEGVTAVYDVLALSSGETYLSAGPGGYLLKQTDDGLETVAQAPDGELFALTALNGQLLAAISTHQADTPGRLAVLGDDGFTTVTQLPAVRYAWDVIAHDTHAYLATGSPAQVLKINLASPDKPEAVAVFQAKQTNLLCLAVTQDGVIYAGSDDDGLIYRLTPDADQDTGFRVFVAFDALEPEIGTLLVDGDTVYAGTADAEQAKPGRLTEANTQDDGTPENAPDGTEDLPSPPLPGPDETEPVPAPTPTPEPLDATPGGVQTGDLPAGESDADPQEAADSAPNDSALNDSAPNDSAPNESTPNDSTPEADTDNETAPTVTPEMRDRLREAIRERLLAARKSGKIKPPTRSGPRPGAAEASAPKLRAAKAEPKEGNAVYRLQPDGFVTEVFRESVMVMDLLIDDAGRLIIATGNEGQIYRVDPALGEQTVLVDLDNAQATGLTRRDDRILVAAANPPALQSIGRKTAPRGQYISPPLDTQQISLFGALQLNADLPAGTSVLIETRSGNVSDPQSVQDAFGWSAWTQAVSFVADDRPAVIPRIAQIDAPPARYLQYRLTLTGDGAESPAVQKLRASYIVPNQPPKISSVQAEYPEPQDGRPDANQIPPAAPNLNINWEATDPNQDRLLYTLSYQPAGANRWITLAEDRTNTEFGWDTRRVPDGHYRIKVAASDRPDNPGDMAMTNARITAPVVVDNTAPTFKELQIDARADTIQVTGWAADAINPIAGLAYAVDSADRYQALLPDDLIADSTNESWTIKLPGSPDRPKVVTIRALDARGNAAYHAVVIPDVIKD